MSSTSTSRLPDEVLVIILAESTLHHTLFNHDQLRGPNYVWSRMVTHKLNLVLVCKRWNRLALTLLYSHIIVRHLTQLEPLFQALSNENLGRMVRELTLTDPCHVDHYNGWCEHNVLFCYKNSRFRKDRRKLYKTIIRQLPRLCQRLKRFSIRTQITPRLLLEIISNPDLVHITEFHFQFDGILDHLHFSDMKTWFSQAAGRIRRLSFDGFERPSSFKYDPGDAVVEFPVLEELRIAQEVSFPANWSLPSLKWLIVDSQSILSMFTKEASDPEIKETQLCSFLRNCGSQIEYLALLGHVKEISKGFPIDTILSLCPKVEYIALDLLPVVKESHTSFPTIQRIDVYTSDHNWNWEVERESFMDHVSCFPSLKSIHILCGKTDFENLFFLLPLPFEVDPIQVFKEACIWLDAPQVNFSEITIPLGGDPHIVSMQCASFQPDDDPSDEDLTYSLSYEGPDERDTAFNEDFSDKSDKDSTGFVSDNGWDEEDGSDGGDHPEDEDYSDNEGHPEEEDYSDNEGHSDEEDYSDEEEVSSDFSDGPGTDDSELAARRYRGGWYSNYYR